MARLAGDAEAIDHMRGNPDRIETCVMELMRVVAMSTSMMRLVTSDFDWRGRPLKRGDVVYLVIAAANRDEKIFVDPGRLDFGRGQSANMVFGPGQHFCIGHWFAKMMVSEFFLIFLSRFSAWEMLDEDIAFTNCAGFRQARWLNLQIR